MPTVAAATWKIGTQVTINWQVVASDGAGGVTLQIDPTGGTNFAPTTYALGSPMAVGSYNFAFTVPNIQCTGAGGLCTITVFSTSNWFSCSSVAIVAATAPAPPPPAPTCALATNLAYCSIRNNINVTLTPGQTAANLDSAAVSTFKGNINNTAVFLNGGDPACQQAYKLFLCFNVLTACGVNGACRYLCQDAMTKCQLTQAHTGLYNCSDTTQYPVTTNCGPGVTVGATTPTVNPPLTPPPPYVPGSSTNPSSQPDVQAGVASAAMYAAVMIVATLVNSI